MDEGVVSCADSLYHCGSMAHESQRLSHSPKGQTQHIKALTGDQEMNRRLRELGFYEGAEVLVRSRMPFGGPLVVEIDDFSVALRRSEADSIQVGGNK